MSLIGDNRPATAARQDALSVKVGEVQATPTANTLLGRLKAIGDALAGTLTARPSTDQDPIFDDDTAIRIATGPSAVVFTPPAGCKFARFDATVNTFIRTDDTEAGDAAGSTRLLADQPEIIPVTAGVAVRGYSATAGVLYVTPLKAR